MPQLDHWYEVRQEAVKRSVRGEPTCTSAGRLKKRVVEQASPAFRGRRRVVIDDVLQDFEQRVERCACLAQRRGVNNERLGGGGEHSVLADTPQDNRQLDVVQRTLASRSSRMSVLTCGMSGVMCNECHHRSTAHILVST